MLGRGWVKRVDGPPAKAAAASMHWLHGFGGEFGLTGLGAAWHIAAKVHPCQEWCGRAVNQGMRCAAVSLHEQLPPHHHDFSPTRPSGTIIYPC